MSDKVCMRLNKVYMHQIKVCVQCANTLSHVCFLGILSSERADIDVYDISVAPELVSLKPD